MMLNIIMRKECNRFGCVLPFCYKLISNINDGNHNSNHSQNKSQFNINTKQSTDNKVNKLENNPYYDKYLDKIEKAKQEKKFAINQNLKNKSNDEQNCNNFSSERNQIENQIKSENIFNDNENGKQLNSESKANNWSNRLNDSLNDILKLDLLREKTAEDITNIWNSYYKSKDCIYAVIPGNTYDKMFSMASKYPTFVFPIPRINKHQNNGNAYEFILCQFNGHKCFFTPLTSYQSQRESASPCLTISHFPELQRDKGIVLMFGKYDTNVLNCFESQCLANQLQWYYSGDNHMKQTILLHTFNKEPNLFKYMDLINELENGMLDISSSKPYTIDNDIK